MLRYQAGDRVGIYPVNSDALVERGVAVFDLSADFRLRDARTYEAWYGPHAAPALLDAEGAARLVASYPEVSKLAAIKDIGRIEFGSQNYSQQTFVNGKPAEGHCGTMKLVRKK